MLNAQIYIDHIKRVIDASSKLGVNMVTTFIGNNWHKKVENNWPRMLEVWEPLLQYASAKGTKVSIENCAMFFTDDEWPAGKNIAYSPKIWRKMFADLNADHLGLNYDPSHLVWMQMDHEKPWGEFKNRIWENLQDFGTLELM
jgi:sugar phosphate isomerase/epimerase